MSEKVSKDNFSLLSIVAIFAIAGIVIMVLGSSNCRQAIGIEPVELVTDEVSDDLAGMAAGDEWLNCSDSDGGISPNTVGTIYFAYETAAGQLIERNLPDQYCYKDTNILRERYCDGNIRRAEAIDCEELGGTCSKVGRMCAVPLPPTPPPPEPIPTAPFCGDGIVNQKTEDCDGADLNGMSCSSFGYDAGTLTCSQNCTLDTTSCTMMPPPPAPCVDTDGGQNYMVKGAITGPTSSGVLINNRSDYCRVSYSNPAEINPSAYLIENYCNIDGHVKTEFVTCSQAIGTGSQCNLGKCTIPCEFERHCEGDYRVTTFASCEQTRGLCSWGCSGGICNPNPVLPPGNGTNSTGNWT
ncbi:hypothetical protein ACFL0W_04160 [Nanoarchaeota archaeon]